MTDTDTPQSRKLELDDGLKKQKNKVVKKLKRFFVVAVCLFFASLGKCASHLTAEESRGCWSILGYCAVSGGGSLQSDQTVSRCYF